MNLASHHAIRVARGLLAGLVAVLLVCLLPTGAQASFRGAAGTKTTIASGTVLVPANIVVTLSRSVCNKSSGPTTSSVSWSAVAGAMSYVVSVRDNTGSVIALGSTTSTSMVVPSDGFKLNSQTWQVNVTAARYAWSSVTSWTSFRC